MEKLKSFEQVLNEIFEVLIGEAPIDQNTKVDIVEHDELIKIQAQLPGGIEKNHINVSFEDQILTISGQTIIFEYASNIKQLLNEIKPIQFKRSFKFKHNIDKDSVKAHFDNGILYIQMNKKEQKNNITIPVE